MLTTPLRSQRRNHRKRTSRPYYYNDEVTSGECLTRISFQWMERRSQRHTTPTTLRMDTDKSVTATFTKLPYSLTIEILGQGTVLKEPDQATYSYGDTVTLTALPAEIGILQVGAVITREQPTRFHYYNTKHDDYRFVHPRSLQSNHRRVRTFSIRSFKRICFLSKKMVKGSTFVIVTIVRY